MFETSAWTSADTILSVTSSGRPAPTRESWAVTWVGKSGASLPTLMLWTTHSSGARLGAVQSSGRLQSTVST